MHISIDPTYHLYKLEGREPVICRILPEYSQEISQTHRGGRRLIGTFSLIYNWSNNRACLLHSDLNPPMMWRKINLLNYTNLYITRKWHWPNWMITALNEVNIYHLQCRKVMPSLENIEYSSWDQGEQCNISCFKPLAVFMIHEVSWRLSPWPSFSYSSHTSVLHCPIESPMVFVVIYWLIPLSACCANISDGRIINN